MVRLRTVLVSATPLLAACGSSPPPSPGAPPPATASAAPVTSAAPSRPTREVTLAEVGLDPSAMDRNAKPCDDFYRFACGGWIDRTEIPADKARWVRSFNEIHDRNEADLREILGRAARVAAGDGTGDEGTRKLGTYYGACLDEPAIEKAGLAPIEGTLRKIAKARKPADLVALVGELHESGTWVLFRLSAEQDFKDATRYLAYLDQGGLGLPDRDYYLKEDDASAKIRETYVAHVERMLVLSGQRPKLAKKGAAEVVQIETELARVSKTKVERRDPKALYNRLDRGGVGRALPAFPWAAYFERLGYPGIQDINVTAPAFLEGIESLLGRFDVGAWRSYFAWHVVREAAPTLGKAFVDESFVLEQALTGQKEQRVRWKRCVDATDEALGELLARDYVALRFSPEAKTTAERMVKEIGAAFARALPGLAWMDDETRGVALEKARAMAYLIGYPPAWRNYAFEVAPGQYAGNTLRANAFELRRQLAKIGRPVDRSEWFMTPPTVNAYYNPLMNHMVFPAGILQPPFYSPTASVAVNMGAMGMVVGHELTHGFDDEGSQFDAAGNLRDWWPAAVRSRFEEETQCMQRQYSAYEALPGVHLDGRLTLGENIADNGGVKLAYSAYRAMRADAPEELSAEGLSEDQQFFVATGQIWCAKARDEYARMAAQVDPHSAPRFRVNGALANSPDFAHAFSCPAGAPMRPAQRCAVW
ncbi:MAG: M13 family metallopeptidase [Polyangiaceae bacterium]|nr:M13 family metallopeptidase [Polyangiaceae bacterium]